MVTFIPTRYSYADYSCATDADRTYYTGLGTFSRRVGEFIDVALDAEIPSGIVALLLPFLATPNILTPEQRAIRPNEYVHDNFFICPSKEFSVLVVVWLAGTVSPILGYKTWCGFGVCEGVIREIRYAQSGAAVVSASDLLVDDVARLPVDVPEILCMHNPTDEPANSIHVYGGIADQLGSNAKKIYTSET